MVWERALGTVRPQLGHGLTPCGTDSPQPGHTETSMRPVRPPPWRRVASSPSTTNSSWPIAMRSPAWSSTRSRMGSPLRFTPLRLPRSSTVTDCSLTCSRAWRRETIASSSRMKHSMARPITASPMGRSISVLWNRKRCRAMACYQFFHRSSAQCQKNNAPAMNQATPPR
jgi:hypothetical protein